jgi:hypothetical protein
LAARFVRQHGALNGHGRRRLVTATAKMVQDVEEATGVAGAGSRSGSVKQGGGTRGWRGTRTRTILADSDGSGAEFSDAAGGRALSSN